MVSQVKTPLRWKKAREGIYLSFLTNNQICCISRLHNFLLQYRRPTEEEVENKSAAEEVEAPETTEVAEPEQKSTAATEERWPGWLGYFVFRVIVAVAKVGNIIGRKGEFVKKMCEETQARVCVLDGPVGNPDRIILITGKENPELPLSPAMDATIRIFKRVSGLSEGETDGADNGAAFCSIRLLVASSQAMSLIGKQGSSIKAMHQSSSVSIRILNHEVILCHPR